MVDTLASPAGDPAGGTSLAGRLAGVVFSPRATYADIAARPRVIGALVVVLLVTVLASAAFFSSGVGKRALMDMIDQRTQAAGRALPDAQYQRISEFVDGPSITALVACGEVIFIPVLCVIVAGLVVAVFNAILGGNAAFKQVFAVVVHSQVLFALSALFVYPLDYVKESLSSATSLAVFLPFLEDASFLGRLLSSIDLFRIWWIVNLSIGLAVLYKRRTSPIATSLLVLYGVIALCIAAVGVALSGA